MSLESLSRGRYPGGVLVASALETAGITHTFGIPGTHNIELYDALQVNAGITPVLVTNEQSAGFMADGMSRSGGPLGCANVVPGAGITHVLSGIAEAWMDNVGLLVLTCGVRNDTSHKFQLHDVDQLALLDPVCKGSFRVAKGEDIPFTILRAADLARSGCPGPVAVEIPGNHYLFRHNWEPRLLPIILMEASNHGIDSMDVGSAVEAALSLLMQTQRPHFHLGQGAADAADLLVPLVERLGGVVTTTFSGKGTFPESHPLWIWPCIGRACPKPLRAILDSCDITVILGARMGEVSTGSYGVKLAEKSIHVDIDPEVPGANFPVTLPVVGDAPTFVTALFEALIEERGLSTPDNSALSHEIAAAHRTVRRSQASDSSADRVSPHRFFQALQQHFPSYTRYTTDSGRGTFLAAEHLRLDDPRLLLSPVDFSCMGYAVPAAIGAALAQPDRPVVALPGDGAFLMTGLELLTAAQQGISLVVFVLRDGELGQIARFQRDITQRPSCTTLPDFNLSAFAETVGAAYLSLPTDADLEHTLLHARHLSAQEQVVLVEVSIDYSQRTYFEQGVVMTNFNRLPWADRVRMVARTGWRRVVA